MVPGQLVLANKEVLHGYAPEWQKDITFGEVVFNTGMTGYEETLTDPSYSGQILTFTYPILGNYGVSDGNCWESGKIHTKGIICQTIHSKSMHYTQAQTFLSWLQEERVPILIGVDTRHLTKIIRQFGVIDGALIFADNAIPTSFPESMAQNWVEKVSITKPQVHGAGKYKIILVDCGAKQNILRMLLKFDTTVTVVPFNYDYTQDAYDGVFLSNGPGDPKQCNQTIAILKKAMLANKPIYGICLGAQLMSLAVGANTYKLKFGHRGQNQPCIDTATKKCYLTSQNHGYAIDDSTLPSDWIVSFRNLNDNTVEGMRHKELPIYSVQYHPEACPGPKDSQYIFDKFLDVLNNK